MNRPLVLLSRPQLYGILQKHNAEALEEGLKKTCVQLEESQDHLLRTSAQLDHAVSSVDYMSNDSQFPRPHCVRLQKHRILRQADIISQRVAAEKDLRAEFVRAVPHVFVFESRLFMAYQPYRL